tara:strand:+ start:1814 stop:2050 length:237 start_codon:yes stop_codon:yes gene_type:complete
MKDCVSKCVELSVSCPNKDCRQWIEYEDDLNCTFVTVSKHGRITLREVAKRMGVSFVRIKQIEQKALGRLKRQMLAVK